MAVSDDRPKNMEVETWMSWAGGALMRLKISSPAPQGYKTASIDYADEISAYNYTPDTIRAERIGTEEEKVMNVILSLPALYVSDLKVRRVLHLRALKTPISGRYLYPYVTIAKILHVDARLAARMHLKGLADISRRMPRGQIRRIRHFFVIHEILT